VAAFIDLQDLSKRYQTRSGAEVVALTSVSFAVAPGEFVSILGPTGCGKSTLLKIVAGLEGYEAGRADLGGRQIQGPNRTIGMVFQSALLLPWRTALQNVILPAEVQGLNVPEAREKAKDLLKRVGLDGFDDKYPSELSGGMQQRVAIARALVTDPTLLLMDEPFGALDAITREAMTFDLQSIWYETKKTAVFVTHSIEEAVFLSDRVVVMSRRPGSVKEIVPINLERPRTLDTMARPEFAELERSLRVLLDIGSTGGAALDKNES
jgi:NitT/TauT family transport system ATP-binding protein